MAKSIITRFQPGTQSIRFQNVFEDPAASNDQVTIPAGFDTSGTSWALSFWICPDSNHISINFNPCCFAQEDGTGTGRAWIIPYSSYVSGETSLFFNTTYRSMGFTLPLNQWSRVGLIYNQPLNKITCFLNGVEYNSFDSTSPTPFVIEPANGSFLLGANRFDAYCFSGNLSMVHMWKDVVLTAEQMAGIHLRNDIPATGLHFSLPMLQSSGDIIDVKNGYNGTLSGGAAWDTVTPFPARTVINRSVITKTVV